MNRYILCETIERDISYPILFPTNDGAYQAMVRKLREAADEPELGGSMTWLQCADLGYCPILGKHSNPTVFDCDKHCPGRNKADTDPSENDECLGLEDDNAWCENANHDNCDWHIYPVIVPDDKPYIYVLCETIERDIHTPELFDSAEAAAAEMTRRFKTVLGYPEEYELTAEEIESFDDDTGIGPDTAWCENANHDNCDWRIFKVAL